ncbi:MAG: UDP-2,4-diacetamido-2,4,6-trideoxy-beta-L-altropyranose hydrolase [Alphaproteobacteria bacterium]|nr:UDP-2,4-diacetamido-2,4,6-trideoxy-beta-L-altropyranose hydrolase [Alphaproteobacteria bacterium]MBT5540863.1 UDP-2,4-diacetamido-2,4,6-trideoxy-beta-L-altropyranose hydrolase [Alphaproteobacteria bacterium]MBT5654523.1 UDP-2,4-diacetamido-2,4,6-trideoxy-beta-L-altropyranose hydrolase [Alphaproteobacteria bacterium]
MNSPRAIFRCDASEQLGAGHVMRCIVLAEALKEKGWECFFVSNKEAHTLISKLKEFKAVDPVELYDSPIFHNLLIVDHYELDKSYEQHFRKHADKILVIDDLANREHDCDILIDQTYGRDATDYNGFVPEKCKILTGSKYSLIKRQISELRPKSFLSRKNRNSIKKILISMGGTDPQNYTLKALKMVKESGFRGSIDVVLGFSSKYEEIISDFTKSMSNSVEIYVNADMPKLLNQADLAIGASGSSIWERCCLGLPSVLVQTAANQKKIYDTLCETFYPGKTKDIEFLFNKCLNDPTFFQKLSNTVAPLIDGFGVNRVVETILSEESQVELVPVKSTDMEKIFQWQVEPELRKHFNNPSRPSLEEHKEWFTKKLSNSIDQYWLIQSKKDSYGALTLSYDENDDDFVLSWYLTTSAQGKGIGTQALKIACNLVYPFRIKAVVNDENETSRKSLLKAGFENVSNGSFILRK